MVSDSAVTIKREEGSNVLGYTEINLRTFIPLGDRILVKWEEATDKIKLGNFELDRPKTHTKIHYTGIVLKVGPKVKADLMSGDRILFDRFGNFEKLWDEEAGRLALISEAAQGSAFAVIPPRIEINGAEGDFDYNAA